MIISRKNFKQAYLVFAVDGTIRFNKKTIGTWMRTQPKWGISRPLKKKNEFTAKVQYNSNSMVQISKDSKLQLMIAVGRNIPDTMLTRATT